MKISVLMAVYNSKEEYLRECIESVLNQTYKDFEFIIVNDGSEENLDNIITSYRDERIRYIKNDTNNGISKVRNHLLDLAKGEYIAICDHDDISLPDRFEKEINFLENHKEYSLVSGWLEFFPEKMYFKHPEHPKYLDVLESCCLAHPACMWRREDFEKYNLRYDESYICSQDYELWSRVIRHLKMMNLQEVILKYRWHNSNTTMTNRSDMKNEEKRVKAQMLDYLCIDKKLQQKILKTIRQHNKKYIKLFGITVKKFW